MKALTPRTVTRIGALAALLWALAACGGVGTSGELSPTVPLASVLVTTLPTATVTTPVADTTSSTEPASSLRDSVRELDNALYVPPATEPPPPTYVTVESIGVAAAPITPVGVVANGDMEIPPASEVGWYRFGPRPGEAGSSVLAAHVAYDGEPGVFRHLTRVAPGDVVVVGSAEGETRFRVVEVARYAKDQLPADRIFARTGEPSLTLITCGGDFNRSLRSYEDNIVAYAVPAG